VQLGQPGPWLERLPHFRLDFLPSSGDELQSEWFVADRHAADAWAALTRLGDVVAPALQVSEVRAIAPDPFWLSPTRGEPTVAFHFTWVSDWDVVAPAVAAVEAERSDEPEPADESDEPEPAEEPDRQTAAAPEPAPEPPAASEAAHEPAHEPAQKKIPEGGSLFDL
jgi:hypothetical protein